MSREVAKKKSHAVTAPAETSTPLQNIKVVVRIRPWNKTDEGPHNKPAVTALSSSTVFIKDKKYVYDKVFRPDSSQMDVYLYAVYPMINDVLNGYNCTVFAYGQTGTGKTYTMTGGDRNMEITHWKEDPLAGCIPRAAANIFDEITSLRSTTEYTVRVSYLELYNEEVRDLLCDDYSRTLTVQVDKSGNPIVPGLSEIAVHTRSDIFELLDRGNSRRVMASTNMNDCSSRSHTVFTITVHGRESGVDGEDVIKTGKIRLVDLAGSENIGKSGAKEVRAIEVSNINKSLLTLGRVIHALSDKNNRYVPYRDSKLTRILKDSLGGTAKTCIIATVSPAPASFDETISTLDYASRARDIKNTPVINAKITKAQLVQDLKLQIEMLNKELDAARSGTGFFVDKENWQQLHNTAVEAKAVSIKKEEIIREKVQQIRELEETLERRLQDFDEIIQQCKMKREKLDKAKQIIRKQNVHIKFQELSSSVYKEHAEGRDTKLKQLVEDYNKLQDATVAMQQRLTELYCINKAKDEIVNVLLNNVLLSTGDMATKSSEFLQVNETSIVDVQLNIEKLKAESQLYCRLSNDVTTKLGSLQEFSHETLPLSDQCVYVDQCFNGVMQTEHENHASVQNIKTGLATAKNNIEKHFQNVMDTIHKNFEEMKTKCTEVCQQSQKERLNRIHTQNEITRGIIDKLQLAFDSAKEELNNMHSKDSNIETETSLAVQNHLINLLDSSKNIMSDRLTETKDQDGDLLQPLIENVNNIDSKNTLEMLKQVKTKVKDVIETTGNERNNERQLIQARIQSVSSTTVGIIESATKTLNIANEMDQCAETIKNASKNFGQTIRNSSESISDSVLTHMRSSVHIEPTGTTPKPTRVPLDHFKPESLPPREVLLQKFKEQYSEDKENDINELNSSVNILNISALSTDSAASANTEVLSDSLLESLSDVSTKGPSKGFQKSEKKGNEETFKKHKSKIAKKSSASSKLKPPSAESSIPLRRSTSLDNISHRLK